MQAERLAFFVLMPKKTSVKKQNIRSSGFILDNRIISRANSFVVQTIAKSYASLLHLG
jgi:hypothetical protein